MVSTFLPSTALAGIWQDFWASPSRWMVHAPHCPMPQPNLVPGRCRLSRRIQSRGVSGGTSTETDFPLTVKVTIVGLGEWGRKESTAVQP